MDKNRSNEKVLLSESRRQSLLKEHTDRAVSLGIPQGEAGFPCLEPGEYAIHRQNNIRIYAYANRVLGQITALAISPDIAIAVFDPSGCLLKVFAQDDVLCSLRDDGIVRGTMWDTASLGPNAISIGLSAQRDFYTLGEENHWDSLKKYAIYFSPIIVATEEVLSELKFYGGIALFAPLEQANRNFQATAFSVANDMTLHINSSDTIYKFFDEKDGKGILFFDVNQYNGKITTIYHNKQLFDIFNMPPEDIYFIPAASLVDPLPKNEVFWEIIAQKKRVSNFEITISVRGKQISCILDTDPYTQPRLNTSGVRCFFDTHRNASLRVSTKMGNSAVFTFENIIGTSDALKDAISRCRLLAKSNQNMMLLGESGVGKDIFAQAIHNASARHDKPFIVVNCGALPKDLISSELFGYESGAFTGAKNKGNMGKFELANGGTLFLDEIGELPLELQATLLRAVEQKQFMRLGGHKTIDVDVKIISATNQDILAAIDQGRFRADLFFRLCATKVTLPPLRDRGRDAVTLSNHFIYQQCTKSGHLPVPVLSDEAAELLCSLPWRGNVRELQNLIDTLVWTLQEPVISPRHILAHIDPRLRSADAHSQMEVSEGGALGKYAPASKRKKLTVQSISDALEACDGNRSEAAQYLGVDRKTLYRHMKQLGIK